MSDPIGDLLTLQTWLSPAFPVGGFTYSHGLEWAIEAGDVTDGASLADWLRDVLEHGAGRSDAILLVHASRAARAGDRAGLVEAIELAAALQPSRERRLEATAQGAAFVRAIVDTWSTPAFAASVASIGEPFAGETPWTHATAVGVAAGVAGLGEAEVAPAFVQAFAANVISAGVRAIPLGQSEGLRILRSLVPVVRRLASDALSATLDDVGGAAFLADVASMRHETQYTRLFRS